MFLHTACYNNRRWVGPLGPYHLPLWAEPRGERCVSLVYQSPTRDQLPEADDREEPAFHPPREAVAGRQKRCWHPLTHPTGTQIHQRFFLPVRGPPLTLRYLFVSVILTSLFSFPEILFSNPLFDRICGDPQHPVRSKN